MENEIAEIREAVKAGDNVHVGEKQYYVSRMNKFFVSLYAMEELEALPDEIQLFKDHPPYKKKELMEIPSDIDLAVKKCKFPVTDYFLEREEFWKAVLSNPLNQGAIEKLGASVQESGAPHVPELQTNGSPYYTVGDHVYLDDRQYEIRAVGNERVWYAGIPEENGTPPEESPKMSWSWGRDFEMQFFDNKRNQEAIQRGEQIEIARKINLPALVEHLNHECEDIKAWEKTHPGKTVQTWLDEIAKEVKYKSCGPLGEPPKGIKFWRINLRGRDESLFYDYIDHKFMFGKTADVLSRKEQEHESYLKRLESLADRLNEKLPGFKDSDTPNLRHYVTDLLGGANKEIRGDGVFSSYSGNGVNLRYVDKCDNPFIPTILYDGNKKTFLAGTLDELEKRQTREYTRELELKKRRDDIKIGQKVTFQPHEGIARLTGEVVKTDENTVVLQCGRATIPVLREKGIFTEAPKPDRSETKEYAIEQALKYVGDGGCVFTAKNREATYYGVIMELTPTFAIQKLGRDVIVHRLKDLEKADKSLIHSEKEVCIFKSPTGETSVRPWHREQVEQRRENRRENDGQSR
jgi:hypothetical protein